MRYGIIIICFAKKKKAVSLFLLDVKLTFFFYRGLLKWRSRLMLRELQLIPKIKILHYVVKS